MKQILTFFKSNKGKITICAVLAAFVLAAGVTLAWYIRSPKTESGTASIRSEISEPALFISAGDAPGDEQLSSVAVDTTSRLFPVSTSDCVNWYYASNVNFSGRVDGYTRIDSFSDAATGAYVNAAENNAVKHAYHRADFTFYTTNNGTYDIYLDPDSPITVTGDGLRGWLDDAVRIALVSAGRVLFVYAPVDESGTGNSSGASVNTFYAVTAPDAITEQSGILTSLSGSPYLAQAAGENYSPGVTAVCTAGDGSSGNPTATVSVYVWLEGTDAQTKLGKVDNESSDPLNVTLKFVGIG